MACYHRNMKMHATTTARPFDDDTAASARQRMRVGVCRYESRAYWKDVHEQSQAYKGFVQRMKDAKLEPEMEIQVFYETDVGHMCG